MNNSIIKIWFLEVVLLIWLQPTKEHQANGDDHIKNAH